MSFRLSDSTNFVFLDKCKSGILVYKFVSENFWCSLRKRFVKHTATFSKGCFYCLQIQYAFCTGNDLKKKKVHQNAQASVFFSPKYYQKVVLLMDVLSIGIVLELQTFMYFLCDICVMEALGRVQPSSIRYGSR